MSVRLSVFEVWLSGMELEFLMVMVIVMLSFVSCVWIVVVRMMSFGWLV